MCTYVTEQTALTGSAKGADGWFALAGATVYFDHPYHAPLDHALNIDLVDRSRRRRVAVELSPDSARELIRCIEVALAAV